MYICFEFNNEERAARKVRELEEIFTMFSRLRNEIRYGRLNGLRAHQIYSEYPLAINLSGYEDQHMHEEVLWQGILPGDIKVNSRKQSYEKHVFVPSSSRNNHVYELTIRNIAKHVSANYHHIICEEQDSFGLYGKHLILCIKGKKFDKSVPFLENRVSQLQNELKNARERIKQLETGNLIRGEKNK